LTSRRRFVGLAAALAFGTVFPRRAFAGSYLDRAALLVAEANRASEFLGKRLYDQELAQVVHKGALARVEIASKMMVPAEVVQAHPHLLLVLGQHERAANGAVEKVAKDFLRFLAQARDEERVLRAVLKQLGWELPE
jgi:hypothetical protein